MSPRDNQQVNQRWSHQVDPPGSPLVSPVLSRQQSLQVSHHLDPRHNLVDNLQANPLPSLQDYQRDSPLRSPQDSRQDSLQDNLLDNLLCSHLGGPQGNQVASRPADRVLNLLELQVDSRQRRYIQLTTQTHTDAHAVLSCNYSSCKTCYMAVSSF